MNVLEQMKKDAQKCNERAKSVWGGGFSYIPYNQQQGHNPRKLVIPKELRKAVVLWYLSGKSRKDGLVALNIKEHSYRKIINEYKEERLYLNSK